MILIKQFAHWLREEEGGQGFVEYAFIIMLIAMVAIAGLKTIAPPLNDIFVKAGDGLK